MQHPDPEALLDEARWLERVARGLVGDAHTAAYLAQDAWLAAQTRPAAIRGERRAWLVGTLQRLVARTFRSRSRRSRREDLAAPSGEAPSAADLTARAEQHERLLHHVRALPEQHRVVLLLRYYDDLPPRAIAQRLGMPVRTVQTQLARGLAQLRERLDAEHPRGHAGWVAALCLTWPPPATPWWAPPAIGVVAIAAAALVAITLWPGERPPASASVATANPVAEATLTNDAGLERLDTTPPAPTADAATTELAGTVVDWHGYPIAGARIMVAEHRGLLWPDASGDPELVAGPTRMLPQPSGSDGSFACEAFTTAHELRAELPGSLTALVAIWRGEPARPPQITVAPAVPLRGHVVDEQGTPLVAARLQVAFAADFDAVAQRGTEGQHALHWTTHSDADGHFAFAAVPAVDDARLSVSCAGHVTAQLTITEATAQPIVLRRWPQSVQGRLLDRSGIPLVGATVANAHGVALTGEDGTFTLPGTAADPCHAAAAGLQPTTLPTPVGPHAYVLAAPALQFRGVLRHADGRPLAHGLVSLADPTVVGSGDEMRVLEAVAAGGRAVLHLATAAADGTFTLGGLAERGYRLRVADPATAAWFATDTLQPGPVVITAPAAWTRHEHTVVLHTADGEPLAAAIVTAQSASYVLRAPGQAERDVLFAAGSSGHTDRDGRVVLRDVPCTGAHLRIHHPATGLAHVPLPDAPDSHHVLERTGEVVVRCAAAQGDEWLELLDGAGAPVPLRCLTGISLHEQRRWPLRHGNSPVLQAPANAVQARIGSPRGHVDLPLRVRPGARVAIDG